MEKIYKLLILAVIVVVIVLIAYGWEQGWFSGGGAGITSIEFVKDTLGATKPADENEDWRTFQIAEVMLYDASGVKVSSGAFSSASYDTASAAGYHGKMNPAGNIYDGNTNNMVHTNGDQTTHSVRIGLSQPLRLSKAVVYNRNIASDASPSLRRLEGVKMVLRGADGSVVSTKTLTKERVQEYTF